jgi:hypothetical protein
MSSIGFDLLREYEVTNNDLVIRRFINVAKFEDLLRTSSLHFSPASKFNDHLEGYYTELDNHRSESMLMKMGFDAKALNLAKSARVTVAEINKKSALISCWTLADATNERMWREYGKSDPGSVCLETTIGKLRDEIGSDFLFFKVSYIDFELDSIPKLHSLLPFLHKNAEDFSWEKEIRIIGDPVFGERLESARKVEININTGIQQIILSPEATSHDLIRVESLLKQAAIDIPIKTAIQGG